MPGIKALRQIQLGREVTPGTAVAATTKWRGNGTLADERKVEFVPEDVGLLTPTHRSHISQYGAALAMESVACTFQQILHLLEAGLKTVTPVADGVGTGKIYTYPFPTTTAPSIKTYTIEGGDNQQAEKMEYAYVESIDFKGGVGEAIMMSANWRGRQVTNATYTAAIAIPVVESCLFQKSKLYINNTSSAYGTTQISKSLLGMSLSIKTGLIAKYTADGDLFFSFVQNTSPEIKLSMTFEHDGNAVAEKTAWRANTPRAIQIKCEGSALTTPGAYTNHTLIFNLPGKYESFGPLGDQDGNDTYELSFTVGYDETLGNAGEIIVVNQLASVP